MLNGIADGKGAHVRLESRRALRWVQRCATSADVWMHLNLCQGAIFCSVRAGMGGLRSTRNPPGFSLPFGQMAVALAACLQSNTNCLLLCMCFCCRHQLKLVNQDAGQCDAFVGRICRVEAIVSSGAEKKECQS